MSKLLKINTGWGGESEWMRMVLFNPFVPVTPRNIQTTFVLTFFVKNSYVKCYSQVVASLSSKAVFLMSSLQDRC